MINVLRSWRRAGRLFLACVLLVATTQATTQPKQAEAQLVPIIHGCAIYCSIMAAVNCTPDDGLEYCAGYFAGCMWACIFEG